MKRTLYSRLFAFALALLLLTGCESTKKLTLNVTRPSKYTFTEPRGRLLVVNNSPNQPSEGFHFYVHNSTFRESIKVDTDTLSREFTSALGYQLFTSNAFAEVKGIEESSKSPSAPFLPTRLTPSQVQALIQEHASDLMLSVDHVQINSEIKTDFDPVYSAWVASYDVKTSARFSLYTAVNNRLLGTFNEIDSIFWQKTDYTEEAALSHLPSLTEALGDAMIHAAEQATHTFIPYTEQVSRFVFVAAGGGWKSAEMAVMNNDWSFAERYWKQSLEKSKKPKVKIYALLNLALASEVKEEYANAVVHAEEAVKLLKEQEKKQSLYKYYSFSKHYLDELIKRKKEVEILSEEQ